MSSYASVPNAGRGFWKGGAVHRATSTPLAADRVRRQEHVRGTKLRGLPRRSARGGILAGLVATLTACATLAAPALAFTPTFETQFNAGFGGDQVGFASAIQGNTIAVGCPWADIRTSTPHGIAITKDKGGVDVYQFDGSYWVRKGRFVGTRLNDAENVGFSVGISEDTIVAGAPSADVNGHVNQGAAYVFAKSGTSWGAQPQQLSAADGTARTTSELRSQCRAMSSWWAPIARMSGQIKIKGRCTPSCAPQWAGGWKRLSATPTEAPLISSEPRWL